MITLTDFYVSFSALCFTILSLWLVVVVQRYDDWKGDADMIWRAYGIGLLFSLPGIMTLLALIDPQSSALWRTSDAVIALGGAGVIFAVSRATQDNVGKAAYYGAIVLYVLIGIIADSGSKARPKPGPATRSAWRGCPVSRRRLPGQHGAATRASRRGYPASAGSLLRAASIRSCGSSKSSISPDR